jgi:WhiB family redox-sensing transcriptional regulator
MLGEIDFWPDDSDLASNMRAKAICKDCPVKLECLQHALDNDEAGIWGGTTEKERRSLLRRRRRNGQVGNGG